MFHVSCFVFRGLWFVVRGSWFMFHVFHAQNGGFSIWRGMERHGIAMWLALVVVRQRITATPCVTFWGIRYNHAAGPTGN
jgi:hypothetical protein